MATGRMIRKKISESEQVCSLPDVETILIYTWLIPHVCDFGTFTADPYKIKVKVFPEVPGISRKHVEEALISLVKNDLITIYFTGDGYVLSINNFDKHQSGLHKRTEDKRPDFSKSRVVIDVTEIFNSSGNFRELPGTSGNFRESRSAGNLELRTVLGISNDIPCRILQSDPVDNFLASPVSGENASPKKQKNPVVKKQAIELLEFLNKKSGFKYKPVESNLKFIMARLGEYTFEELRLVIASKCGQWMDDEDNRKYLRPQTLFNQSKCGAYVGQLPNRGAEN